MTEHHLHELRDPHDDPELDQLALNIAKGIHHRARQQRRAEIERLEAQITAERQRILDERNAP